ncbi:MULTISPECIES: ferredoxin--NADP reductase [Larkinella]|uniref:Oxidoreductase n=1 Tax=Larkinella punicea TaxID=2315727 RepID=A0A368JJ71_9BACT|nr:MULTISPECIES: ferredoxin--NADP reductase [Larkinella]RCR67106.1 hypothetical protein DUE52_23935 [Larkinella punicea]
MKTSLSIKRVVHPTTDSVTLYFDTPENGFTYYPGQHLAVTAIVGQKPITRTYSLSTSPVMDSELAITVKRIPDGVLSNYLVDYAKPEMPLTIEGPLGQFYTVPDPVNQRHLVLFAGGSGITPLYSMIRSILYAETNSVISLIYANRSWESVVFREELNKLQIAHPDRFSVYHALDQYSDLSDTELKRVYFKGSLSRLLVKKFIARLQTLIPLPTEFYMCGPFGFMQLIEQALESLNIPANQRFKEQFFVPAQEMNPQRDYSNLPTQTVQVLHNGLTQSFTVPSGQSILDAALAADLKLPYLCREAQCGSCRAQLLRGKVDMERNHSLTVDEIGAGQVLLCRGFPLTPDVIVQPLQNQL